MQFKSRAMGKGFPADFTPIRLLTAVNALMNGKLRSLREPGAAMSTSVRFVLFVGSHVLRQVPFQFFVAYVAVKRPNVRMVTI